MFAGSVALLLTLIALAVASKGAQADPTPFPWDKLSKELQEAARSASLPSRFIVATYINVTERLLMGESVFVPGALDPVIWNALTTNDKFVLEDYWKRYVNVPGSP